MSEASGPKPDRIIEYLLASCEALRAACRELSGSEPIAPVDRARIGEEQRLAMVRSQVAIHYLKARKKKRP